MEISQHIKNLLKFNERVILGGFGAFNTKHISAKYDAETKTMKPPFKIVVFDPNTKEDAGLLAKHMAEQEGISLDNANEQIREYVKTIKAKLSQKQSVEFKDLGTFSQGTDGKLKFAFLSEDNLLVDSFGLPTVSLGEKKIATPATPPPETKKTIKEKKPVKQKTVRQKPIRQKPVKKQTKEKKTEGKPRKKRKVLFIFLIFIGAVAVMLAAVYFFKPDLWAKGYSASAEKMTIVKNKIANLFGEKSEGTYDIIEQDENEEVSDTSSTIVENVEATEENNVNVENTDNEEIAENEETSIDNNTETEEQVSEIVEDVSVNVNVASAQKGKYYIIVGSVKTESSAKKEQQRFSAKGISTSIIHVANIGRYRISAGEFTSVKEAQNAYSEIQSKHGNIDAWVWEKR